MRLPIRPIVNSLSLSRRGCTAAAFPGALTRNVSSASDQASQTTEGTGAFSGPLCIIEHHGQLGTDPRLDGTQQHSSGTWLAWGTPQCSRAQAAVLSILHIVEREFVEVLTRRKFMVLLRYWNTARLITPSPGAVISTLQSNRRRKQNWCASLGIPLIQLEALLTELTAEGAFAQLSTILHELSKEPIDTKDDLLRRLSDIDNQWTQQGHNIKHRSPTIADLWRNLMQHREVLATQLDMRRPYLRRRNSKTRSEQSELDRGLTPGRGDAQPPEDTKKVETGSATNTAELDAQDDLERDGDVLRRGLQPGRQCKEVQSENTLPGNVQFEILRKVESLLEGCYYDFASKQLELDKYSVRHAEDLTLTDWADFIRSQLSRRVLLLEDALNGGSAQDLCNLMDNVKTIRNALAHRSWRNLSELEAMLDKSIELCKMLGDEHRAEKLDQLKRVLNDQRSILFEGHEKLASELEKEEKELRRLLQDIADRKAQVHATRLAGSRRLLEEAGEKVLAKMKVVFGNEDT